MNKKATILSDSHPLVYCMLNILMYNLLVLVKKIVFFFVFFFFFGIYQVRMMNVLAKCYQYLAQFLKHMG